MGSRDFRAPAGTRGAVGVSREMIACVEAGRSVAARLAHALADKLNALINAQER